MLTTRQQLALLESDPDAYWEWYESQRFEWRRQNGCTTVTNLTEQEESENE